MLRPFSTASTQFGHSRPHEHLVVKGKQPVVRKSTINSGAFSTAREMQTMCET
jgi:hypothetical protein